MANDRAENGTAPEQDVALNDLSSTDLPADAEAKVVGGAAPLLTPPQTPATPPGVPIPYPNIALTR